MKFTLRRAALVCLLLLSAVEAKEVSFAGYRIDLPAGYVHEPKQGIDSICGDIITDKKVAVHYDIGEMAGLGRYAAGKENVERVEVLRTPVGTGQLAVEKADVKGRSHVHLALPPHANFSASGPAAEAEAAVKALAKQLSLKTPLPAGLAAALGAAKVEDGKKVKISAAASAWSGGEEKLAIGDVVIFKLALYVNGKPREITKPAPGEAASTLVDADEAAAATLVIEGEASNETGRYRITIPVAVSDLLEATEKKAK